MKNNGHFSPIFSLKNLKCSASERHTCSWKILDVYLFSQLPYKWIASSSKILITLNYPFVPAKCWWQSHWLPLLNFLAHWTLRYLYLPHDAVCVKLSKANTGSVSFTPKTIFNRTTVRERSFRLLQHSYLLVHADITDTRHDCFSRVIPYSRRNNPWVFLKPNTDPVKVK
jgi:hypothetical protein